MTTVRRRPLNPPPPHGAALALGVCGFCMGGGIATIATGTIWAALAWAFALGGVGGIVGFWVAFAAIWQDIRPAPIVPATKVINGAPIILEMTTREGGNLNIKKHSLLPPRFDRDAAISLAQAVADNPMLTNAAGAEHGIDGAEMGRWRDYWVSKGWAAWKSSDPRHGVSVNAAGGRMMQRLAQAGRKE